MSRGGPSFAPIYRLAGEYVGAVFHRLAPCVGQHSRAVLRDLLGYSEDTIYQLSAAGVVA